MGRYLSRTNWYGEEWRCGGGGDTEIFDALDLMLLKGRCDRYRQRSQLTRNVLNYYLVLPLIMGIPPLKLAFAV